MTDRSRNPRNSIGAVTKFINSTLLTVEVTFAADDADGDDAFRVAMELRDLLERQLEARPEVTSVQAEPFKVWCSG